MNRVEMVVIDLLKRELITIEEAVNLLKEVNEISDKTLAFNYDNKNGSNVRLTIPSEIIKTGFGKIFERVSFSKKEENSEFNKDDIVKNILKLIK